MYDLVRVPEGATARSVTAVQAHVGGRDAIKVELPDEITNHGTAGVDYVDQPTFLILPDEFRTGTIEVDVLARLNQKTSFDARGFAGVAFHINDACDRFEAFYVRTLNGRGTDAPAMRKERALQYFAYPEWPFDRLREERPGVYEKSADVVPDEWFRLTILVEEARYTVFVDDVETLRVSEPLVDMQSGRVGLFVDIGTEAFFSGLRILASTS